MLTVSSYFSHGGLHEHLMCQLMAPVDIGFPVPSQAMNSSLYEGIRDRQIYHYQDCTARALRDCQVYKIAQAFLQDLLQAISATISSV